MKTKITKVTVLRSIPIYIMMLPGLIYLLCNNYLPMFGIMIAFKKINWQKGLLASDWTGFKNFEYLFKTKESFVMVRNTLLYNIAFIMIGTVTAIAVAILLNEVANKLSKKIYQSVILLPYLMSMVVVSYLVYALLSSDTGFVNNSLLVKMGIEPINWYQETKYWPFILVIVNIWKNIGFSMIIYYSSIVGISPDFYEAARLDGANKWQQIQKITLPLLVPTIITLFIMSVGRIFSSDFGLFYQVTKNSGALYPVTQTIDTFVYNALMKLGNLSMSSAASVYQALVGFVLVMVTNKIVRKYSKENAFF